MVGRRGKRFGLIPTALRPEIGQQLRELIIREQATRTCETGLALGISTLFILSAHDQLEGETYHAAIDPLQSRAFDAAGLGLLERAGVRERLDFWEDDSKIVLPQWVQQKRSLDLAFIDGDHRFEGAFLDLYYLYRIVRPGGILVVDDLWMPSVHAAVSYFTTNMGCEMSEIGEPAPRRAVFRLRRQRRDDRPRMITLRIPDPRPKLRWDEFEPFWQQSKSVGR